VEAVGVERIKFDTCRLYGMNVVGQEIDNRMTPFSATGGIRIQGHLCNPGDFLVLDWSEERVGWFRNRPWFLFCLLCL
jgi:hypothetical protein